MAGMAHRSICQEQFDFAKGARSASLFDALGKLIDWTLVARLPDPLHSSSKSEPARKWRCSRPCFCRSGTSYPM
jgi:hypothetical protein